ncbi:MAG TPA: heavy metal-associated domain-containing protein [Anaerolineales bacterium]|nr:heavy metal-associated domain-containing protein [Anaerolineales bacterium]
MNQVVYSVSAIHCGHCVHTIQSELSDLEGVKSVKASSATKQVEVIFEHPASEESIKNLLKEINYPAAG